MNVGLPGTGLGGLFYILSIFFIMLKEIYYVLKYRTVSKKWTLAKKQISLLGWMIVAVVIVDWLLSIFFVYLYQNFSIGYPNSSSQKISIAVFSLKPIIISFFILCLVVLSVYVAQFVFQKKNSQ